MARCTNCNFKWKARHIWMLNLSKDGKPCKNCGIKQYIHVQEEVTFSDFFYYVDLIPIVSFIFSPLHVQLTDQPHDEM